MQRLKRHNWTRRLLVAIFICSLVSSCIFPKATKAVPDPSGDLTLTWQQATSLGAVFRALSIYGDNVYLAGYDTSLGSSDHQWRIEKRDLTTGALIPEFGTGGIVTENPTATNDQIYSIATDASGIYLAGYDTSFGTTNQQWHIEKRDLTTGALIPEFGTGGVILENPSVRNDSLYSMTIDGSNMYVGGFDCNLGSSTNCQWRIEKRDLTTGALIPEFGTSGVITENPSGASDIINATVVDGSYLYFGGYDGTFGSSDLQWRIEKRDKVTGALITDFDTDGIITENPGGGNDYIYSVSIDSSGLYVAGYDSALGSSNQQWRIEKRDLASGALITEFGTGGVITENFSDYNDLASYILADTTGLYIGGQDRFNGSTDTQWRIEKRDLTTGAFADNFGTNGTLTYNFDTGGDAVSTYRSMVMYNSNLYVVGTATDVGTATIYSVLQKYSFPEDSIAPVFNNLPGDTVPINITEGQTITTNPYVINVYPTDNIEVAYVQFLVDGVVICTDYTADVNGIYSCSWDTYLYHSSLVQVIAYDTTGNTSTILARNTTVDPALYTSLPNTGSSAWIYLIGLVPAVGITLIRRLIRQVQ